MNSGFGLLLVFGIGLVTGLRSMTAPAVVAWAAHMGWISLSDSPLAFMGSVWAVAIFTLGALAEFIGDKLPTTPPRTVIAGLTVRVIMGSLTGACVGLTSGVSLWLGALLGAMGAITGAFGGFQTRVRLVRILDFPDIAIAVAEDLVAIGLGLLVVSRF